MKKFKKIVAAGILAATMVMNVVGCGAPKLAPAESAKVYLDVILKGDKTNIGKVGMTEDQFKETRTALEDSMMAQFTSTLTTISDEQKTKFKDDLIEGMSKLEYEVEDKSEDKETATVIVKIKGFNLTKITTIAQENLKSELEADPSLASSQNELLAASLKFTGAAFAEGNLVDEAKDIELQLDKKDNAWTLSTSGTTSLLSGVLGM